MRKQFAKTLHKMMADDHLIYLITADLGYHVLDDIKKDYPTRFLNVGAAEQAMLGIAIGLEYEGWKPVCYSITNFLLYRPFEWIRNYLSKWGSNVKLVGSGRDMDYEHDNWSHQSLDARKILNTLDIEQYWPKEVKDVDGMVKQMMKSKKSGFISLAR